MVTLIAGHPSYGRCFAASWTELLLIHMNQKWIIASEGHSNTAPDCSAFKPPSRESPDLHEADLSSEQQSVQAGPSSPLLLCSFHPLWLVLQSDAHRVVPECVALDAALCVWRQ